MDAHRRLNPNEGDAALRALFRESGHRQAPEGTEARILQRIAAMPAPARPAETALMPRWMWMAAGALMLTCVVLLVAQPGQAGTGLLQRYIPELPAMRMPVLSSSWFLTGVVGALSLLAADALLARRAVR